MIVERLEVGPFGANCYLVACPTTREAVMIDPGGDGPDIISLCRELGLKINYIINTHGHMDHVGANKEVKEAFNVSIIAHQADFPLYRSQGSGLALLMGKVEVAPPDKSIKEGDVLQVGSLQVETMETPGHTQGSITLKIGGALFAGDTLFAGSIGRTDLPGGSFKQIIQSIKKKILAHDDDTSVFTGHGPPTNVGRERRFNPFLN